VRGKPAFGKKDERFLQSRGYGRIDFRADDGAVVGRAAQAKRDVLLGNAVRAAEGFTVRAAKRVGLIINPSGVIRKLDTTLAVLRAGPGVSPLFVVPPSGVIRQTFRLKAGLRTRAIDVSCRHNRHRLPAGS